MASPRTAEVLSLRPYLSELLLCGRCFRRGVRRRVRQLISPRHKPLSRCPACRRREEV